MAEKILNTRILLKYDTLENWNASEGYLRAGEVAIATVGTDEDVAGIKLAGGNPPQVLVKVGDGKHKFADLPYITAKAGDVYAWAKKAALDYTDLPATLKTAITNYETRIGVLEGFMTGNGDTVGEAINTAIAAALEGLAVEDVTGGKVVTKVVQNNGKIEVTKGDLAVADLTDGSALKEEVNNLKSITNGLADNYASKAAFEAHVALAATDKEVEGVKEELEGAIADVLGVEGDAATAKTVYGAHAAAAAAAQAAQNAQTAAEARVLQTEYNTKIGLIDAKDAKQDERLGALEGQITNLSGAMHFEGVKNALPEGDALAGYENGDVIIVGNKEYVFNNGAFVEFGDAEVNAGAITNLTTRVKAIEDAPYATTGNVATAKAEVIGASTDASTADTIYGAKKKAEEEAAAVLGTDADAAGAATVHGALKAAAAADVKAGNAVTAAATADGKAVQAQNEVDALELVVGAKTDTADKDTVFGAIAKTQGEVDALEELVGDAADTKDDDTVYGAIAAEKARAEQAEGNLQTQINTINSNKTTVSTTKDAGLIVTPNGNDYKVDIDDTVTFVFNCGTSANLDTTPSVTA